MIVENEWKCESIPQKAHIERLRGQLAELESEYSQLVDEIDRHFHPYWGSLLKEMNGMSNFGCSVNGNSRKMVMPHSFCSYPIRIRITPLIHR